MPEQVTVLEDLGVCQLLSEIANVGSVEAVIRRWLGTLLDYDTTKSAQSDHDLNNPDTRFNLQLTTRARKTLQAIRQQP